MQQVQVSQGSPRSSDQRDLRRTRTLLRGVAVYGNGAFSLHCAIRDLSAGGARVSVPEGQSLPHNLFLINVRDRVAYETEIAWMKGPQYGLKVVRTHNLQGPLPGGWEFLRRLWVGLSASFVQGKEFGALDPRRAHNMC